MFVFNGLFRVFIMIYSGGFNGLFGWVNGLVRVFNGLLGGGNGLFMFF